MADRGGPDGEPPGGAGREPDQRDPQSQAGRPHPASAELRLVRVLRLRQHQLYCVVYLVMSNESYFIN